MSRLFYTNIAGGCLARLTPAFTWRVTQRAHGRASSKLLIGMRPANFAGRRTVSLCTDHVACVSAYEKSKSKFISPVTLAAKHVYEVRPREDKRGVERDSDVLPFGRLWYAGPDAVANAIGYAEHRSRSHRALIHA